MLASGFSWFHLIPFFSDEPLRVLDDLFTEGPLAAMIAPHDPGTTYIAHAFLICGIIIVLAIIARMGLEKAKKRQGIEKYFADDKLNAHTFAELFTSGIMGIMDGVLSRKDAKAFFPLVAGLFAYIWLSNLIGIVPGFLPPTGGLHTNLGMALVVFLVFNAVGLIRDPVNYVKHLAGPVLFLAPMMFIIELISLVFRPVSLTVRLTGNMYGDHTVFTVMSDLVPIGLPALLLILAILVATVQAFVFSMLTVVYIALAVPHDDHDH